MKNHAALLLTVTISLLLPLCAADKKEEVPNAPAIRASLEEVKFRLEEHRKGKNKLEPKDEFRLIERKAGLHHDLGDMEAYKKYDREADDLIKLSVKTAFTLSASDPAIGGAGFAIESAESLKSAAIAMDMQDNRGYNMGPAC